MGVVRSFGERMRKVIGWLDGHWVDYWWTKTAQGVRRWLGGSTEGLENLVPRGTSLFDLETCWRMSQSPWERGCRQTEKAASLPNCSQAPLGSVAERVSFSSSDRRCLSCFLFRTVGTALQSSDSSSENRRGPRNTSAEWTKLPSLDRTTPESLH